MKQKKDTSIRQGLDNRSRVRSVHTTPRPSSFNYYTHRESPETTSRETIDKSKTITDRKNINKKTKPVLAVMIVLILIIFSLPSSSPETIIVQNSTSSSNLFNQNMYDSKVEQFIDDSIFNHTKITFNSHGLESFLKASFPEIENVRVSHSLFSFKPKVFITLTKPVLQLKTNNSVSAIALNGLNLGPIPNLNLPVVEDNSSVTLNKGALILPSRYVQNIIEIVSQLKANGVSVEQMALTNGGSELDLTLTNDKFFGKFDLNGGGRLQSGSFLATISYLKKNNITPSEYIDVMVPGRAYYK